MPGEKQAFDLLVEEVRKTPSEYWPALLQMLRAFREAVTLKPAELSFRKGWREALRGETEDIETLWEGIDAE